MLNCFAKDTEAAAVSQGSQRRSISSMPALSHRGKLGLLLRAGFPRPRTQIPVYDEFNQLIARLDMGWEDAMIAAEYDGDHHRTNRRQFNRDIARTETLTAMGWIVVRITSEDTPAAIIRRVELAFARRV